MKNKKKLLLIEPKNDALAFGEMPFLKKILRGRGVIMNASLATIAALTPKEEFDITVIDEKLQKIDFDAPWDMVGVTAILTQYIRAREIIAEFTKRGVLVVIGGSSVSLSPERWRPYADVLMIGEAERIWPEFVADYLAGRHQKEYRETERFDLSICPVPDYSYFSESVKGLYAVGIVQTSRGCPFNCEFCDVINYVGRTMRYKPLDKVMREIEQMRRLGINNVFLADDNFSGNREKAKEILHALRDWNRRQRHRLNFFTQLSIDIAQDDDFLRLAAEAGLLNVFVGIESPNIESLKEARKLHNVRSDMIADVKKFHQFGIQVVGSTIVGFDHDDLSIFRQHLDFHKKSGIIRAQSFPLQAPDGSALRQRLIKEGRYRDWGTHMTGDPRLANIFTTFTVVPKQMTIDQLRDGVFWLNWQLWQTDNLVNRVDTFFDNFHNSPYRHDLQIPKSSLNSKVIGLLWRFFKYYFFEASLEDRKIIKRLLRSARRSTHPLRFRIALSAYFSMRETRDFLRFYEPQIENLACPGDGMCATKKPA
jgi:radical SAM superfamily enzyme YgiQ (UPF0313 family)